MPTHRLRLNIDLPLLKKQLDDMAEVAGHGDDISVRELWPQIDGVINLLGEIRDQIDPPILSWEGLMPFYIFDRWEEEERTG